MEHVIIATQNAGKVREFERLFAPYGLSVTSLLDYEKAPDVEETGTTLAENAILKAEAVAASTGEAAIADDSGLVIDALDGRPGVCSARYAGQNKNEDANIDKVLRELNGTTLGERTAHFQCVLATAVPNNKPETFAGKCAGLITFERKGKSGFGYDPIFYVPSMSKTMAELSSEEKNCLSHRASALSALMKHWRPLSG